MNFPKIMRICFMLIVILVILFCMVYLEYALETAQWNTVLSFTINQVIIRLSTIGTSINAMLVLVSVYIVWTLYDHTIPFKLAKGLLQIRAYILKQPRIKYLNAQIIRVGKEESIAGSDESLEVSNASDELEDDIPLDDIHKGGIRQIREMNKIRQTLFGKQLYDEYVEDNKEPPKFGYFNEELDKKFKDQKPKPSWNHFSMIWKAIREEVPEDHLKGGRPARSTKAKGDDSYK